jgi:hypothetical protein
MGDKVLNYDDPRAMAQRTAWAERQRRHRAGKSISVTTIQSKARRDFRFVPVWKTPSPARDFIRSLVEEERSRVATSHSRALSDIKVFHLCCGSWHEPGWINIDRLQVRDAKGGGEFREGDVFSLEERNIDVIVSDPPFPWPLDYRSRFNQVVTRSLCGGGLFILNAPWFPVTEGLEVTNSWGWIRSRPAGRDAGGSDCSNVVLISTARKGSRRDVGGICVTDPGVTKNGN